MVAILRPVAGRLAIPVALAATDEAPSAAVGKMPKFVTTWISRLAVRGRSGVLAPQ
jgi:hypothetical protein